MKKIIFLMGLMLQWRVLINATAIWDNSIAYLVGNAYTLCDPSDLITPRRFDLMAKYIYAQAREWDVQCLWPLELYREHIKVWVNFHTVPKDGNKKTFEDFLYAFHKTLDSIKYNGFDYRVSIVPIGDGDILNGAHRLIACLLYKHKIAGAVVSKQRARATADFFKNRRKHVKTGLGAAYLDAMALQYAQLKNNLFMVILPSQSNEKVFVHWLSVFANYGDLVYRKKVTLTTEGIKNVRFLLEQHDVLYGSAFTVRPLGYEVLLMEYKKNMRKKASQRFAAKDLKQAGIIAHPSAPLSCAQTFFNANGLVLINTINNSVFKESFSMLDLCKKFVNQQQLNPEFFCLVGDSVKALLRGEACSQFAFISHGSSELLGQSCTSFINKNTELAYQHEADRDEIIFNPAKHFYYNGIKCAVANI